VKYSQFDLKFLIYAVLLLLSCQSFANESEQQYEDSYPNDSYNQESNSGAPAYQEDNQSYDEQENLAPNHLNQYPEEEFQQPEDVNQEQFGTEPDYQLDPQAGIQVNSDTVSEQLQAVLEQTMKKNQQLINQVANLDDEQKKEILEKFRKNGNLAITPNAGVDKNGRSLSSGLNSAFASDMELPTEVKNLPDALTLFVASKRIYSEQEVIEQTIALFDDSKLQSFLLNYPSIFVFAARMQRDKTALIELAKITLQKNKLVMFGVLCMLTFFLSFMIRKIWGKNDSFLKGVQRWIFLFLLVNTIRIGSFYYFFQEELAATLEIFWNTF